VNIKSANNIEVRDLVNVGNVQIGMNVDLTRNVTVDRAYVSGTEPRNLPLLDNKADIEGCFSIGAQSSVG